MTTKRVGMLAGTVLSGALILGTAGLTLAQDPTPTPSTSPGWEMPGGMMGGGTGMMGGGTGMMGGQTGTGMMGNMEMNGTGMMSADQLRQMTSLHDQMVTSGTCDSAQMQQMHAQHHAGQ